ncbi:MAG: hypothetical protein HPY66_1002 [Firmicutes bacterium]|nr:hypothetical protein [Bacillota bacterium]
MTVCHAWWKTGSGFTTGILEKPAALPQPLDNPEGYPQLHSCDGDFISVL